MLQLRDILLNSVDEDHRRYLSKKKKNEHAALLCESLTSRQWDNDQILLFLGDTKMKKDRTKATISVSLRGSSIGLLMNLCVTLRQLPADAVIRSSIMKIHALCLALTDAEGDLDGLEGTACYPGTGFARSMKIQPERFLAPLPSETKENALF